MDLVSLLIQCVKNNASDLHIASGCMPMMRVNGLLEFIIDAPIQDADKVKSLVYSVMNAKQITEFEQELELDFSLQVLEVTRIRVNVFHENNGISAAFRIIPDIIPTMEQLALPAICKKLVGLPNGLILVTGPTGSGKSTTLAALINYINETRRVHIITIEDPVEFIHTSKKSLVRQRQVHRDTHRFSNALRSALREDPDVILLGEMRDLETIRMALTAAETGHLVMGTLHASSATRTINRVVDVFPVGEKELIRKMLSDSLQAVICQTLVNKIGGGRIAASEIMLCTPAIRNLIREDKISQMTTLIQTGADIGMRTLQQSLQELLSNAYIDNETAFGVVSH